MVTTRSPMKSILHQTIYNELNNINNGVVQKKPPPVFISTNPSHINIDTLSKLYLSCNVSPHRFPSSSTTTDTDIGKLAVAVSHSPVVVSVFAKSGGSDEKGLWGSVRVSPEDAELVGFGRAISDLALTATIFDVMVIPTLRRVGIGRMIVQRIIRYDHVMPCTQPVSISLTDFTFRMLSNRGIYDISAVCSDEERLFFAACGFGGDPLGSTTMLYAATASNSCDDNQIITRAGRKLLVAPPSRLPFSS